MSSTSDEKSSQGLPAHHSGSGISHLASSFLLASSFFIVAAIVAFFTYGLRSPWLWGFVILAVISFGVWFAGESQKKKEAGDARSRQRALLGLNAVSSSLLVLVLLVGINYIAARRQRTFDLTRNKVNTLASQTRDVVSKLADPVTLTYVYVKSQTGPNQQDQELLRRYSQASDKITVRILDAAADPSAYRLLDLTTFTGAAPEVLVQLDSAAKSGKAGTVPSAATRQELSTVNEQNITSALMKLMNPKPSTIYFLTGHGEVAPTDPSFSTAKEALEAQNFTLQPLLLLKQKAEVPADAAAVFIVGPRADMAAPEEAALKKYLAGKGRLALFLSPTQQPLSNFDDLAKSLGVNVETGEVVDQNMMNAPTNVVAIKGDASIHPILAGVTGDLVLPDCVPLKPITPAIAGTTVTPVFSSSAQSGRVLSGKLQTDGPFTLVAAVEKGDSRALVCANANLLNSAVINVNGNRSFLTAAANWTVGNDSMVTIPPKPADANSFSMPVPTLKFAQAYSLLLLPFLVLLFGTAVWWRRR